MAIITQQESFLLKFKQENSKEGSKPIEVSVTKSEEQYIIELRYDKKSSLKIDLDSLKEILHYVDSKINLNINHKQVSRNIISDTRLHGQATDHLRISGNSNVSFAGQPGLNGPSPMEVAVTHAPEDVAGYADLLKDISKNDIDSNKNGVYNSQADVILSNAIDISSLSD